MSFVDPRLIEVETAELRGEVCATASGSFAPLRMPFLCLARNNRRHRRHSLLDPQAGVGYYKGRRLVCRNHPSDGHVAGCRSSRRGTSLTSRLPDRKPTMSFRKKPARMATRLAASGARQEFTGLLPRRASVGSCQTPSRTDAVRARSGPTPRMARSGKRLERRVVGYGCGFSKGVEQSHDVP